MRFRRRKGREDDEVVQGEVVPEEPAERDPASWTLPADAVVTSGADAQDTADMQAVAPATAAGGAEREEPQSQPAQDEPEPERAPAPEPTSSVSGAGLTSPSLGLDAEPRAAAAASQPATAAGSTGDAGPAAGAGSTAGAGFTGASGGGALATLMDHPTVKKHPELLVAGAFVGAFLVARILKRISE